MHKKHDLLTSYVTYYIVKFSNIMTVRARGMQIIKQGEKIMNTLCWLVVIGIVCFVGYVIWMFIDDSTQMRRRQVDEATDDFNDKKNKFDEIISNFFNNAHDSYQNARIVVYSTFLILWLTYSVVRNILLCRGIDLLGDLS